MLDMNRWTAITNDLDWGVQRVVFNTLDMASKGVIQVAYSTNVYNENGKTVACLVNAMSNLISTNGVSPSQEFGELVCFFDCFNREMRRRGVNKHEFVVSPISAEILVTYFASPLKDVPENAFEKTHREMTDEDLDVFSEVLDTDKVRDIEPTDYEDNKQILEVEKERA